MKFFRKVLLWFCIAVFLLPFQGSAGQSASVPNAEDISSVIDGGRFRMYRMPSVPCDSCFSHQTFVYETFPGGIGAFSCNSVYSDDCGTSGCGLVDRDGRILLQPDYMQIYTLEQDIGSGTLPNLLVAVDEEYQYRIFNCRTGTLLPETYDYVGEYFDIEASTPEERYQESDRHSFQGYFIPVYRDGDGWGMADIDGTLIIPCEYENYRLVHDSRIVMYNSGDGPYKLFDENGSLLNDRCRYIGTYYDGMAYATRDASDPEDWEDEVGYLDFHGTWVFSLANACPGGADSRSSGSDYSDGLVLAYYQDAERNYDRIPIYLDKQGNLVYSAAAVYDQMLRSTGYVRDITATDFVGGRAVVTVTGYDWESDAYPTSRYLISANGESKKLSGNAEIYDLFDGGAFVSTTGNSMMRDNILTKWGYYLLDGSHHSVSYVNRFYGGLTMEPQWICIRNNDSGLCAYLSVAGGHISDFLYADDAAAYALEYEGVQYLSVERDGKIGVLGPDAAEVVPCVYDLLYLPEGEAPGLRGYFVGGKQESKHYVYTLYGLDGSLISEHDQFTYVSAGLGAIWLEDAYGYCYVVSADGRLSEIADGWLDYGTAFSGSLVEAAWLSEGEYDKELGYHPYNVDLGFIDENGAFHLLARDGNEHYQRLDELSFDMRHGMAPFSMESDSLNEGILCDSAYSFSDWWELPGSHASPIVEVLSVEPADGANHINPRLETVEVTFNQDILLMDPAGISLYCPLSTPDYYFNCRGNKLQICFTSPLEYGEPYTLTIDPAAVCSAYSRLSVFDGYTSAFKLNGLSAEELLTYYPQYLETPDSITVKYLEAGHAVDRALDEYAGPLGIGEKLASVFYAAKNYVSITADEISRICGWGGTGDELQEEILDLFLSQACISAAEPYENAKDISEDFFDLVDNFDLYRDESYLIDLVDQYVSAAGFRLSSSQQASIVKAVKKATNNSDFLSKFSAISNDFNDIAGEYISVLISYVHMNTETANSMLRHLTPESELYQGLKQRVDAMSGDNLYLYLSLLHETLDETFDLLFVKSLKDVLKAGTGSTVMSAADMVINVACNLYDAVTEQAEVTEYIKTIMFTEYTASLDNALLDLRADMITCMLDNGSTTAQQRADFEALYRSKHSAWLLLLEQASRLFEDSDSNTFSRNCLDSRDVIASDCDYARYLYECKLQAPHSLNGSMLAAEENGNSATVTGFLRSDAVQTTMAAETALSFPAAANTGNSAAAFTLTEYSDSEVFVDSPEELLYWLGYEPPAGSYDSVHILVTGDITLESAETRTLSSFLWLEVCEGASLTVAEGTELVFECFTSVSGTLINSGTITLDSSILVVSQPQGALVNNGTIRINRAGTYNYGSLESEMQTTVTNNGTILVSGQCVIRGSYLGNEPSGSGTILWPTRPIAVPDSQNAWGELPYRSVTIPSLLGGKSVDTVADAAFADDAVLCMATIAGSPSGTAVGADAFRNCSALTQVRLGNVSRIGAGAFADCALYSVLIPACTEYIGADAFRGVSVIYGTTVTAQQHAASIGAAYVDVSGAGTLLEIYTLPDKTVYEVGEALDLRGLSLRSGGQEVPLDHCYVTALPAQPGTHTLSVYYLDAVVNFQVTVGTSGHSHVWSSAWSKDDDYHWHECTAGGCDVTDNSGKDGYGAHSYYSVNDASCEVCGHIRELPDNSDHVVAMYRMYNPNTGEHFYTGSTVERDNLLAAGWNYEGIGFHFYDNDPDPVYRLFDPITGEHLYTMDAAEIAYLQGQGWNLEGVAFNSAAPDKAPQYRLHNPNESVGAYHFTNSLEERATLLALGWEDQGIGFYSLHY